MHIKEFWNITEDIEFVNIDIDKGDNQLFLDPYRILCNKKERYLDFSKAIVTFFTTIVEEYRSGKEIEDYFDHFNEISLTRFGYAKTFFKGKGTGAILTNELVNKIKIYLSDFPLLLEGLEDITIFIEGIKDDRISDMTTAICLEQLESFTMKQCELYNKKYKDSTEKYYFWDSSQRKWVNRVIKVVEVNGYDTLLTPKELVGDKIKLGSFGDFVQIGILGYLKENYE